ncbi:MAG: pilus assembly PilX N-terminal domain-containing protein [Candidatus Aminicenantes bacterium]|nr:pilus assembly PilX N-terminal domain-containing protein [Candidatus Aminicenantes bacterium]
MRKEKSGKKQLLRKQNIFSFPAVKTYQPAGSGLIVVILVLAFMLTVGVAVLTVTSSGPKVSATMRYQEEAFNAAEAGFDAARMAIEDFFGTGQWVSFSEHCLTQPTGIDIPFLNNNLETPNPGYFRRLTDEQILSLLDNNHDGIADYPDQVVFFEQPFVYDQSGKLDQRYRYTVFLIDDEAGAGVSDPMDVLMVCIGVVRSGPNLTDRILATCRLEIELEIPQVSTHP